MNDHLLLDIKVSIVSNLKAYAKMTNIANEGDIKDEDLQKIGNRVLVGFNEDLASMSEWLADVKKVEELASLSAKKKNYPLPNSANIKYPLISKAAYEFSSRTYPELFKDGKIVKARVVGYDSDGTKAERACRIEDFLNYEMLFADNKWEQSTDRLLMRLALIGFICKKSYYDPIKKRIKEVLCEPQDLVVNSDIEDLDDARRISHVLHVRLNDLVSGKNTDVYLKEPVDRLVEQHCEDELDPKIDLIEQHTFLDLDDDDYQEPYIVTVIKETGEVIRIAPRFTKEDVHGSADKIEFVDAMQLFTDYHFLVNPKGKFQSVGFGILMLHLNETINTLLNQLVDAGQLANLQGGYKDSRLKNISSGDREVIPGEFISVKAMAGMTLKDGIVPFNFKEPSSVLFQLLGLMIQAGKELSSSSEVMTGGSNADNAKTGAVMALQAEGMKVFTSLHKRLYRSLTDGFKKLYVLNSIYMDPEVYFNILDDKKAIFRTDFDLKSIDVIPTADPNLSSELQRSARTQLLLAAQQLPGTDKLKITKLILINANLGVPVSDVMPTEGEQQPPDPVMLKLSADIQHMADQIKLQAHELDLREKELQIQLIKAEVECAKLKADAILSLAKAEAAEAGSQMAEYNTQLSAIDSHIAAMQHAAEFGQANQMHQNDMNMQQQQLDQQSQEAQQNAQPSTPVDAAPSNGAAP